MIYYLRNVKQDVAATPLSQAAGGEGFCCRIARRPRQSLKIYNHPVPRDLEARLNHMMANPIATIGSQIAWPQDIVEDGYGEVVGYLQQHFPAPYISLTALCSVPTRPRWATPAVLRRCAYEAAYLLAELHAHEYLFPDIHGDQFLVAKHRPTVLVDAASCQFTAAGQLFPCNNVHEEYQAPELQGAPSWAAVADQRDEYTDAWSLSDLIFQLTQGCHAFDGVHIGSSTPLPPLGRAKQGFFPFERLGHDYRPPKNAPPYRHVDPDIREFFHRAFVEGNVAEKRRCRPTAADWADLLRHCPQLRVPSLAHNPSLQPRPAATGSLAKPLVSCWDYTAQTFSALGRHGWTTAIAIAVILGIAAVSLHVVRRDANDRDFSIPFHSDDQLGDSFLLPDRDPTAPSIDSLIQRLRDKTPNPHKEPEP